MNLWPCSDCGTMTQDSELLLVMYAPASTGHVCDQCGEKYILRRDERQCDYYDAVVPVDRPSDGA